MDIFSRLAGATSRAAAKCCVGEMGQRETVTQSRAAKKSAEIATHACDSNAESAQRLSMHAQRACLRLR